MFWLTFGRSDLWLRPNRHMEGTMRTTQATLLGLMLFGCIEDPFALPQPTYYEPELDQVLDEVSGTWSLQTRIDSDCPAKGRTLGQAHTLWQSSSSRLLIEAPDASTPAIELHTSNDNKLVAHIVDSHEGCVFFEDHTMEVYHLDGASMSGNFQTNMGHNGHADCQGWIRPYLLPKACTTWTDWNAVRTEP